MSDTTPLRNVPPAGAKPPRRSGNAPGGTPQERPHRSVKAPAVHDPFRRPSSDPTLGEGKRLPTTPAWAPTPTLTDRRTATGSALVIGEVLVDIIERGDGAATEHPGGSPANVAVGLARLGRDVELVTSFAGDARGSTVRSHLEGERVRVAAGSDRAARTSTARARIGQDGGATYTFDIAWEPVPAHPAQFPHVVHVGSIGAVLEPGARTVADLVRGYRPGATITYDPNIRPDLMGSPEDARERVEALVARADVVKVSDEDLRWLYPGEDHKEVARRWLGSGAGTVVVTTGAEGAWAVNTVGETAVAQVHKVAVADTVGAGDAFMAGIIDALWTAGLLGVAGRADLRTLRQGSLQEVVDHAAAAAAITVSRPGADPPTRAEIEEFVGVPGIAARPVG